MYRNYFQLSVSIFKYGFSECQLSARSQCGNYITKRWAGHSKWANIKHTKMEKDRQKSLAFGNLSKRIMWAVKEGGEDIKVNYKLRALWEEARKISMPNATFQTAVKGGKAAKLEKPYWVVFARPNGLCLGFEVISPNTVHAVSKIGQFAKRLSLKHEKHHSSLCCEKGILISDPLNVENALDKAMEDAIEVGIDEVMEDDDKSLIFECVAGMLDVAHKKLADKGYVIHSATTQLLFNEYVKISKEESDLLQDSLDKLYKNYDDVLRVTSNVTEE